MTAKFAVSLGLVALMTLGAPSLASTINTIDAWNHTSYVFGLGDPSFATVGQTFVASGDVLTAFTFFLQDTQAGVATAFDVQLLAWNGSRATGDVLFQSGTLTTSGSTAGQRFDVSLNEALSAGQQYVIFLSTSAHQDSMVNNAGLGYVNNTYAGGNLVYLNNGPNVGGILTSDWIPYSQLDLAFSLQFSSAAVPLPSAAGLGGVGLIGLAVRRSRR